MKLRPYQEDAVAMMQVLPALGLLVDMGLGKTAATLHALVDLPKPVLLVGPIRVIETVWGREAAKWPDTRHLSFSLVRGSPSARRLALSRQADIYLTNPELLPEVLDVGGFKTLVIDESSMFKNSSTKRFKTLRKYLKKFGNRYILTGTPTPNSLMELWSQVFILDQGQRLDTSFGRFKERYFQPLDYHGYKWEAKPGAEEEITRLTSDILFRVEAKGNLPAREVVHNSVRIFLPPKARKTYETLEEEALVTLANEETITAASAAAALMKLRQVASGFVYDDEGATVHIHNEKIEALRSILEETGSPVIVVYYFQHELAALKKAFPQGWEFSSDLQGDWDQGKLPLIFLHPQSGGHGLNLQYGGHTMVIFSGSFSYEQMSQTIARIDRQGQEYPVVIHSLMALNTVDDMITDVLQTKEQNQTRILDRIKEYARAKTRHS